MRMSEISSRGTVIKLTGIQLNSKGELLYMI